ncbi:unnamed protein product [Mytilus coruscus]|uniref:Uncharacterized protein n=1 Tax=Mytilus coruscus TaxID=42192 RepID=A0A6J8CTU7_MYTCO|nr:unnamed protein product [Mytilus coruscus]
MINKNQLTCLTPAVNIRNESKVEMPIDYPTRLTCRGKVNYCGLCNEDGEYTWKSGRIILQLVNGFWTISVEYDAIQKHVALSSNNICGLSCTSELKIQLCPSGGSTEHCMTFNFKPHSSKEKQAMRRVYEKLLQIQKGKDVQPDRNKTVTNRPPLKQIDVHHGKPQDDQNKQLPSSTSEMQKLRNRLSIVACRGKIKCFGSDPSKLPWRSGQSITQKCYELSPDTIKTVYCFTQLRLTLDFGKNSLLYFHLIPMKSVEEEKMKNVYEKLLEIQKRNPVPTIIENMSDSEDDSFNEYEIAPTQCKVLPGRISPRQHKVTSMPGRTSSRQQKVIPMPGRTSPMEITLNQNQDKEALEHVEISPSEMEIAADTETEVSADAETSYIPTCQNLISTDTDSSSKVHLTQLTTQLKCSGKMKLTGEELSLPKWRDGTLRMKCVNGSWDMDLDYYVIGGGMITINYNVCEIKK